MRTKEKSTRVYFVRHGQTDFPLNRIYCDDKIDPALNRRGILQAKSAAVYFQDVEVDAIYASPAMRTLMTAREIADVTGLEVRTRPDLMERRFGIWEGLYFDEIEQQYPDEHQKWKAEPVYYTPQGGETISEVGIRLSSLLGDVLQAHHGGTVVIVTHVGPIRIGVTLAFDIPMEMYRQIRIDYAGISRIDYGETRNNLMFLNTVRYK